MTDLDCYDTSSFVKLRMTKRTFRFSVAIVYHDRDYMDIAWPSIGSRIDNSRLDEGRLLTNWDIDISPIEQIILFAEQNGFQPSFPNLSPMAKFIELMSPGVSA